MGLVSIGGNELLVVSLPAEVLCAKSGQVVGSESIPLCLCGTVPGISLGLDKSHIGILSNCVVVSRSMTLKGL